MAWLQSQGDVNGTRFADNTAAQGGSIHLVGSIVTNVYSSEFSDGQVTYRGVPLRHENALAVAPA